MAKLLYSMGEVTEMFDVNASLIRYWESKFDCIRPRKNKKGNRLFTPEDIENLKLIYHLVKEKGMTLEGANRTMKHHRRSVAGDASLLEHLQKIRAMLVEVRESLKDDGRAAYEHLDEPAETDAAEPQLTANGTAEPHRADGSPVVRIGQPEQSAAEEDKSAKGGTPRRRRRKSDDDKELFPFYEQSLF